MKSGFSRRRMMQAMGSAAFLPSMASAAGDAAGQCALKAVTPPKSAWKWVSVTLRQAV